MKYMLDISIISFVI